MEQIRHYERESSISKAIFTKSRNRERFREKFENLANFLAQKFTNEEGILVHEIHKEQDGLVSFKITTPIAKYLDCAYP